MNINLRFYLHTYLKYHRYIGHFCLFVSFVSNLLITWFKIYLYVLCNSDFFGHFLSQYFLFSMYLCKMECQMNCLFILSLCFVYNMFLMTKSFWLAGVVISQIGSNVHVSFQEQYFQKPF